MPGERAEGRPEQGRIDRHDAEPRGENGIKYISNSGIRSVLNNSKRLIKVRIEVTISTTMTLEETEETFNKALNKIGEKSQWIINRPIVEGFTMVIGGGEKDESRTVTMSILFECQEQDRIPLQHYLRREIYLYCEEQGIKLSQTMMGMMGMMGSGRSGFGKTGSMSGMMGSGRMSSGSMSSGMMSSGSMSSGIMNSGSLSSGSMASGMTDSGAGASGATGQGAQHAGTGNKGSVDSEASGQGKAT